MKTGQLIAQNQTSEPQSAPNESATKTVPEAQKLSTGSVRVPKNVTVAKVHDAKEISSKSLWTAHSIAGGLFLFAVLCIVFAKGPTRRQALIAQMNQTK